VRVGVHHSSASEGKEATIHLYSTGQEARSPLKASRRSVLSQRTHSNLWCSYPAVFMAGSCSTKATRISEPHATQRTLWLPENSPVVRCHLRFEP
jgi:hypothetical protein